MKIEKDCVVQFHYQLKDQDMKLIEDSRNGDPMAYLHGHNNIFPKMETELLGKDTGATLTVSLEPEDAYGVRQEDSIQRVSRKHIATKGKLTAGMVINVNTDKGHRQVVVNKVGKFVVDVDTNHPMAGLTLTFEIEIIDVREATNEEITHGHAHGAGGHHH
jgi:FKBP-type peptidyl-prolyl cis-trans isomerase SlyD